MRKLLLKFGIYEFEDDGPRVLRYLQATSCIVSGIVSLVTIPFGYMCSLEGRVLRKILLRRLNSDRIPHNISGMSIFTKSVLQGALCALILYGLVYIANYMLSGIR